MTEEKERLRRSRVRSQLSPKDQLREVLLVALLSLLFRVLRWTWRIDEAPYPEGIEARLRGGRPVVFGHLHEDEWALLGAYAHRRMTVLVSLSRDGSLMARFLEGFGYQVLRGSPARNAVAGFLGLIRRVKELDHKAVSLAIDGPKGPRRQAKKGLSRLAGELSAPIVVGAAYADRAWVFRKSWSKAFVPKPFAHIRLHYAAAIPESEVELALDGGREGELLSEVSRRLVDAKKMAREELIRQRTGDKGARG